MRSRFLHVLAVSALALGGLTPAVMAADKPKPDAAASAAAQIATQLAGDADARAQGLAAVYRMLDAEPGRAVGNLRAGWMKALLDAKQDEEADKLAVRGIVAAAQDTGSVEFLLGCRIRALLALGKAQEALANAKALYNVGGMANTSANMLTVAECLNAAYPQDAEMAQRFAAQQTAGARAPADGPATRAADDVLAGIALDGAPWKAALAGMIGEDFPSLMARGNLLLMSDRAAEARVIFERAYAMAADGQLQAATEALARCMKAQDGSIGRANAWVMSIRPAKKN